MTRRTKKKQFGRHVAKIICAIISEKNTKKKEKKEEKSAMHAASK
jgi:hypothetical protein